MRFTVHLAPKACKVLESLDRATQRRIRQRLRDLEKNPRDSRISKRLVKPRGFELTPRTRLGRRLRPLHRRRQL